MSAVVSSYVGEAAPVASDMITSLLPVPLSSATVRNTLAELADLSLVEKPHRSAGRIPTLDGFRVYVGQLLEPRALGPYEERDLAGELDTGGVEGFGHALSRLLSERTRQLGFVLAPRLDRVVLQHVSFVRVSTERILCVLVSRDGTTYQRVFDEVGRGDQPRLDQLAGRLNERVAGETLATLRRRLLRETADLQSQADQLLERALRAGRAASGSEDEGELLVATWLALLEQPEFRDVARVRTLHRILEENQRLVDVIDRVLHDEGVTVVFGDDTDEEALHDCAIVAAPYGGPAHRHGFLGVIGPSRLDYQRVVPLVGCLSRLASEWMGE
jgi:heat-inducible transcriptional repressor